MMFRLTPWAVALLLAGTADAKRRAPFKPDDLFQSDIPSTGEEWRSMPNGREYQPASDLSPLAEYHLRRLTTFNDLYPGNGGDKMKKENPFSTVFVDGSETYYSEYAQAWRALGFYIDCDYCGDDDGCDNDEEDYDNQDEDDNAYTSCQRFMLWAAYVDEGYSGGGYGEYAFYDRRRNKYDYSACKDMESRRCVKMDCHEKNTQFKLLGFFKEPEYDEWMEQLFKHQGDCVWDDFEFNFMQADRETWPQGCTKSNTQVMEQGNNVPLYYDLKPEQYGDYGIGLYLDKRCSVEYSGSMTAETVLKNAVCNNNNNYGNNGNGDDDGYNYLMCQNMDEWQEQRSNNDDDGDGERHENESNMASGNIYSLANDLKTWNEAFDVFKQCQPCRAMDLTNYVARSARNSTGYRQQNQYQYQYRNNNNNADNEDEDGEEDDAPFQCDDSAGYTNVNQCMKFATKTEMLVATWRDVELAGEQGSITRITLPRQTAPVFGSGFNERRAHTYNMILSWLFLLGSAALLGFGFYRYLTAKAEFDRSTLNEPLVPSDTGVVA